MLRGAIMCPNADLRTRLEDLIKRAVRIGLVKSSDRYLTGHELERFVRANAPQVVFLSIESLNSAINVVTALEEGFPAVQVVAVDRGCEPSMLLNLMNHGVREFLPYPFDMSTFQSAVRRLEELQEKKPAPVGETDRFFCFLPSKAGVGASTVAMNAAVALSRMPEASVLLMDLDVNSGLIGFMLKLQSTYTLYEAAENAAKLDERLWPQLVARSGTLDILPAGRLDIQARIEPAQLRQLLSFARRLYKVICADLSGNLEKYSLEVMHESQRIFVVCTPEIPSLHLARQKIQLLRNLDLGDRVSVLLNRAQKRMLISGEHIRELLGMPVHMEFPNDYRGVHEALTAGRAVGPGSEFGRQAARLAHAMLGKAMPAAAGAAKKRLLNLFAVPSTQYSLSPSKE